MPRVDVLVLQLLNQFAHRSQLLDAIVVILVNANLLKGVVPMAILWGLWFDAKGKPAAAAPPASARRGQLLACCVVAIVSVLIARLLAHALPYRERPLHTPGIGYVLPYTMEPQSLIHWSSFPSDHAVLFFALAVGLFQVSRRWGMVALAHAAFVISLPRLFLGIHWCTDIVAGAVLGVVLALLSIRSPLAAVLERLVEWLLRKYTALCYAALFGLTYLIATLFDDARYIGSVLVHLLRGH